MSASRRRARALSGARVALRPLREEDIAVIEPWLQGAGGLRKRSRDGNRRVLAITRGGDDGPVGVVGYRFHPDDGWLVFELVAVEPALRGLGLESEAVRLLEEETARRGQADRFGAQIDRGEGLGLYFWLRLGYRPVRPGEATWQRDGQRDIIPMIRAAVAP